MVNQLMRLSENLSETRSHDPRDLVLVKMKLKPKVDVYMWIIYIVLFNGVKHEYKKERPYAIGKG